MNKRASSLLLGACALTLLGAGIATTARSTGVRAADATVLLFLSTDCPISARYTPRINAIYDKFSAKNVEFKALFPNDLETRQSVEKYMAERQYKFPFDLDLGAVTAKKDGVVAVPTAVVLKGGKVSYIGAIDDNDDSSLAKLHYLEDALSAVVEGKKPPIAKTPSKGCVLMPGKVPPSTKAVSYNSHVAEILNKHCAECHRPGEVAPFSVLDYQNARKWAPMIANVTKSRQMPPWKAVHGYGEFQDENTLSETEIETLRRWSEAGAPQGSGKAPKTPSFPTGEWPLGQPDVVLQPGKPFKLDADGGDVYRNFVFKTDFKEPRYVTAMAVRPGNKKIVHHVIAFVDTTGGARKLEASTKDGQEGYISFGGPGFFPDTSFGGWAPGIRDRRSPEGYGFRLKPGADVVLQVHYHKDGKPEEDQTKIGLYFSKAPAENVLNIAWVVNPGLVLPANDSNKKITMTYTAPRDITVYALMPHMHLLGKSMKADLELPDGSSKPLIFVDKWDFNWQISYMLKEPLKVPKGSKIHVEAFYDNSTGNPNNPRKEPQTVYWGEQTTDEMCLLVTVYTVDKAK